MPQVVIAGQGSLFEGLLRQREAFQTLQQVLLLRVDRRLTRGQLLFTLLHPQPSRALGPFDLGHARVELGFAMVDRLLAGLEFRHQLGGLGVQLLRGQELLGDRVARGGDCRRWSHFGVDGCRHDRIGRGGHDRVGHSRHDRVGRG